MATKLEQIRAREQAAREYIPKQSMVTGEHHWIMSLRKPQWAIDQALLLAGAEAAVALIGVEPVYEDNYGWKWCVCCGATDSRDTELDDIPHRADCPWLLAKAAIATLMKEDA